MSTFRVPIVRIGKVGKHPNADTLSITTVEGCPVIFRTGDFNQGDIAIYVPVDAVVPATIPGTEFLGDHRRIKAKKLRGIFSMGLLLSASLISPDPYGDNYPAVGQDVSGYMGITKYEEPIPLHMQTEIAPAPKTPTACPVYDMESYRKYKHILIPGEPVVVTEKIHGTNSRYVFAEDYLHVGSHNNWKKHDERNLWWRIAKQHNLGDKLSRFPGFVFYGETYGQVQDLKYGAKTNELRLAIFDIFDTHRGIWLDWEDVTSMCRLLDLPTVPVLYHGPYIPEEIEPLCDGSSRVSVDCDTQKCVAQIREGFVIKPEKERWNQEIGRTIMKMVGENYLTRKGGTELH